MHVFFFKNKVLNKEVLIKKYLKIRCMLTLYLTRPAVYQYRIIFCGSGGRNRQFNRVFIWQYIAEKKDVCPYWRSILVFNVQIISILLSVCVYKYCYNNFSFHFCRRASLHVVGFLTTNKESIEIPMHRKVSILCIAIYLEMLQSVRLLCIWT